MSIQEDKADPITWLAWLSAPYFAYERDRTGKHPFECAPFVSREVLVKLTVGGVFAKIPLSYIESRLQGLRNPKTYPPPKDAPMFTLRDMVDLLAEYVAIIPSGGGLIPQVFLATQLLSADTEADLSVFEPDGTKHGIKLDDNLWWYLETERTGLVYPSNPETLPSIDLKQLLQQKHPSILKHRDFDVVWKGKNGLKKKNVIDLSANLLPYDFRTSVSLTIERT